ncbi:MAG: SPOR domain-containing protein [Sphingomonadaceae bacterium]|jgi:hypothetical protein
MTGIDGDRDTSWDDNQDDPLETEQLALDDQDDRLPWLESSDDEEYDEEGAAFGQTVRLALMAVVALGAIIGGIYWATHRASDPALVADGSLVPADVRPYKESPKDPGGKTFDGTGDTSFAVSEGQSKPAQIAGASAAPAPSPAASQAGAAPAATGVGVQVGAFSSKDKAEAFWTQLGTKAGGVLSGVSHRVVQGTAEAGTVYRLQAVAPDMGAAQALCGKLKSAGISCQVK